MSNEKWLKRAYILRKCKTWWIASQGQSITIKIACKLGWSRSPHFWKLHALAQLILHSVRFGDNPIVRNFSKLRQCLTPPPATPSLSLAEQHNMSQKPEIRSRRQNKRFRVRICSLITIVLPAQETVQKKKWYRNIV